MARGKQRVFREELCTMAGPNCLRLLLCVWLCLSMSNITSHRGASARANTHTNTVLNHREGFYGVEDFSNMTPKANTE